MQQTGRVYTKQTYKSVFPEHNRRELANTLFHEMKHMDQERRDSEKFSKKYESIRRKFDSGERTYSRYYMNPYETEAKRYGEQKEEEPYLIDEEKEEKVKKFFDIIE